MELKHLYEIAKDNNIQVHSIRCPCSQAISLHTEDSDYIGLDRSVLCSESRERQVLAHELGHCLTGAFYCDHANKTNVSRMEYRALKKEVELLIPKEDLFKELTEDYTIFGLAEHFGVSEGLIKKAFFIYFRIVF